MQKFAAPLAMLAVFIPVFAALSASYAQPAKPTFLILRPHADAQASAPSGGTPQLQTWQGSFQYNGHTYTFAMVGTDPSKTNTTTTINVYILPVRMVYTKAIYGKKYIFDPMKNMWNGQTIVNAVLNSPIFQSLDWQWGSTDMGATQYVDAFQRGSFWQEVSVNTNYHVVLTPTVLSELTLKPTKADGGAVIDNPFGPGKVGEMNLSTFDFDVEDALANYPQINASNFPLLITDNVYLTDQGCCVGGYNSFIINTRQTYAYATFVTSPGAYAQDISAISHVIGVWYDDPFLANSGYCGGGDLDVAAPLGGKPNYGEFDVTYNGVTWHPQALAFLEYFGAPANFSANNWLDDQNIETSVCEDGP